MNFLPPETLRKLLRYDPETGKLFWRERGIEFFKDGAISAERAQIALNRRCAGKEAFTTVDSYGYLSGGIFGRTYKAHRVIWAMNTGEWPVCQLDHINGTRSDNRMHNLREVSNADNGKNQSKPRNNKSGVMGVCWHKRDQKWQSLIYANGRAIFLGSFKDFDVAVAARLAAEIEHGFHENHGRRGEQHARDYRGARFPA